MTLMSIFSRFFRRTPEACEHADLIKEISPTSPDACPQCVEMGDTWVNLRVCLECGHVGCCDASKNTHATKHHHATGHPVIQSYQPGETWRWCYVDEQSLPDAAPFR